MAKCPRCGIDWKWDWSMDIYRALPDLWVKQVTVVPENEEDDNRVDMFVCHCGKIIGFNVVDDDGCEIFNHPEWSEVDWDKESYPEY